MDGKTDGRTDGEITVERSPTTATVVIRRPVKRNAMTRAMWQGLGDAVTALSGDPTVRVLVVRGDGDHFCAGADISEFVGGRSRDYDEVNRGAEAALASFPAPTIAAIRGHCMGGGVSIAAACDLRVASDEATFGVTPARLGIVYPADSLTRLVSLVGVGAAKRLLFTGDLMDAAWAERHGLVDEVVPPGEIEGRVADLAALLATRSLLTQRASKEMIAEVVASGVVSPATSGRWHELSSDSGESSEGVSAFLERRRPDFRWSR